MRINIRKNETKKVHIICLAVMVLAVICIFIGIYIYQQGYVYNSRQIEAGTQITVRDFLKRPAKGAYFAKGSDEFDTTVPGTYHLIIKAGMLKHHCTLTIKDTVAPVAEAQEVKKNYGEKCEPSEFVKNISDVTKTTVSFVNEPDYETMKEQNIKVSISDEGNNVTVVEAKLLIYKVQSKIVIEANEGLPEISSYIIEGTDAELITDISAIDFTRVGAYTLAINVDGVTYDVDLEIVDTNPPEFEVKDLSGFTGVRLGAEQFVTSSYDVSGEVSFIYEKEPDFGHEGMQSVAIIATDSAGNQSRKEAELSLIKDTEPPVINGAKDMHIWLGQTVAYKKNVSVSDNSGAYVNLAIDSSAVNINEEGVYPVVYTATDGSGNVNTVSINLTVKEKVYSQEMAYELADDVLRNIFGMNPEEIPASVSKYDTVKKIYDYIRGNIYYVDMSNKEGWIKAACDGLESRRGDCYTYASVAKVLLTRAGIKNMDIWRIPEGDQLHYWNLVDIEDGHGWYHYDTTPRTDHPYIFLWDDATITAYSDRNYKCHNYDRNLFPYIP